MTENKERENEREKENKKNGSSQNIERETQNDTLKKEYEHIYETWKCITHRHI